MTLKEIISELDMMLPNPYSDDEKTSFINKTLCEIKRFAAKTDVYRFKAVGTEIYPLPAFLCPEDIKGVAICGREIPPKGLGEEGDAFFALIPSGYILLHGVKKGDFVSIFFLGAAPFKKRADFESDGDFLAQETALDGEWKYLLLRGAAADIALSCEDSEMSNSLRAEFNVLCGAAMQGRYIKSGKYPKTRSVKAF